MLEYRFGKYGVQCRGGANDVGDFVADMRLVGSNPEKSKDSCNTFGNNWGCLNGQGHKDKLIPHDFAGTKPLDGLVHGLKAVVYPSAVHCFDPLCPVCCYAWAKRLAGFAMLKFDVFSRVYQDFEIRHLTVSVPSWDFDKPLKFIKRMALCFVEVVGCVGGLVIFHPKRYNKSLKVWYFSPHFHVLGFVRHGFVDGQLVKLVHDRTGYVLRNFEKRKSVIGTVLYQLSHAGVSAHLHTVNWFGELKYNRRVHPELKEVFEAEKVERKRVACEKDVCPICGQRLHRVMRVANQLPFDYKVFEEGFS